VGVSVVCFLLKNLVTLFFRFVWEGVSCVVLDSCCGFLTRHSVTRLYDFFLFQSKFYLKKPLIIFVAKCFGEWLILEYSCSFAKEKQEQIIKNIGGDKQNNIATPPKFE
jgi:hypothetical protein